MTAELDRRARMLDVAMRCYQSRDERAAMRGALGDGAGLCDAIVHDILAEHRGRSGKGPPTKQGRELAAIAKRCGDALWAMREAIRVTDTPPPPRTRR